MPDALLASCAVRGSVLHAADHSPVTELRVLLARQDGTTRVSPGIAKAEITGNAFVLTDLPVSYRYLLLIEPTVLVGATWSPARVSFSTTVDGAEVHVRVPEWGTLPVRLVAPEGKNLEGVTWSLSRDFLNTRGFMPGSVDATGRGSREDIVPGDYQLSVLRSFAIIHQQDVTVLPA